MPGENPILNNPYEEPRRHYSTGVSGELDYAQIIAGRRIFTGEVQSIPVRQKQPELIGVQDMEVAFAPLLVNRIRREVGRWRAEQYPQTTRITRELLNHWFIGERDTRLFFAQREAIETAIWLNEVAEKSNSGNFILRQLEQAQSIQESLPRLAFKMATGTGKTVVMAALIAYHFFNRQEYGSDTRFNDNFLVIAPGVTIRDRLSVLRVDTRDGIEAEDYYSQRSLIPRNWRRRLHELNSRLVITNYHGFEPKTLQGNKRSPSDGKVGPDGRKHEAREDWAQALGRLMRSFRPGSRLLVLNDEAHHCYLPKDDARKAEGEDAKEENKRAAVWFSGVREITQRFKVRSIYDLSATPYFLTGSGYEPYSLFPWVVSDFGLTEAIESGLVKIPFLPTWDDAQQIEMPVLRNLYEHVKDRGLPKAGVRKQRSRAKEKGEELIERPPVLPDLLQVALTKFYKHYEEDYHSRIHSIRGGDTQLELTDSPPVFIVVCNNTAVSKEVYKYLAGYETTSTNGDGRPDVRLGQFDLFSNYDPATRAPRSKPPTLLIDSDALENSGQIDADFKRVFETELEQFKRDYARVHGSGSAEDITDAEILREAVNTVGKRGALGHHIRCVVSVSMLTEGWDANTVTHVVGLRAFGSQLLCEQVAGRALRRVNYSVLLPYDANTGEELPLNTQRKKDVVWKFPPEYAHIIGVPFKLYKGGTTNVPKANLTRIYALPDREALEITFPVVDGYRIEYPEKELTWDFSAVGPFVFDASNIPLHTTLGTAISAEEKKLSADDILAMRDQQIIFDITRVLLRQHFSADVANPEFQRFHELRTIVTDWYDNHIRVLGRSPDYKKLVALSDRETLLAHITRGISAGSEGEQRIIPILNYYNPTSCTCSVRGQTSRETYPTRFSHVNAVILDSGWEGRAAKVLDDLAAEHAESGGRARGIEAWVKNSFLDFRIPYTDKAGKERTYFPDFIVRMRDALGDVLMLIIEVTGARLDKPEKLWTVRERWIPAVHSVRERYEWPRWDVLELEGDEAVADLRNLLLEKFNEPGFGIWKDRAVDARAYVDAIRSEWDRE